MAQRPIWRGHLRLALMSCPVALYGAHRERGTLRFDLINSATNHRIRMLSVDAETGATVERRELVKGYEFRKDHYLILSEEDFDSVRVPSSSTMTVEKFVHAASLDPIYYDASYYLAPDGEAGADVYAVMRDAVVASGKVALSNVVISRRERVIAIAPMQDGLIAHTLHEERDLNPAADAFDRIPKVKSDPEMLKLATQLIDWQTGVYDPKDVEDRYETRLRAMIEAKLKGEGLASEEAEPDRGNVVDLMAALKCRLGRAAPASAPARPPKSAPSPKRKGAKAEKEAGTAPRQAPASAVATPDTASGARNGRNRASLRFRREGLRIPMKPDSESD